MTTQNTTKSTSKNDEKQDLQKLLEDKDLIKFPQVGEIVKGKVISVGKNEVRLDLDGMSTGVIRGRELTDESGEYSNLKVDDDAEATVLEIENESGEVELSFRYAGHKKAWDRLTELMNKKENVDAEIFDANKGGLMIKVGKIAGFMPVSQLSPEHYPRVQGGDKNRILEKLKGFVGETIKARIIAAEEQEEKLIISEKAAVEEQQQEKISQFKIGNTVDCKATAITDFGVFVTFADHMEGLIHISELAWQRIDDPRSLFKVGQEFKAEIISIEESKIFLSIKKLEKDPWEKVSGKYKIGQIVTGKVLKVNPFGLFVELDESIHGLAHISELSYKPINDVKEIASPGDNIDLKIISIEPNEHRLGLSLKRVKDDPNGSPEPKKEKEEVAKEEKEPTDKKDEKVEKAETPKEASAEAVEAPEAKPATPEKNEPTPTENK